MTHSRQAPPGLLFSHPMVSNGWTPRLMIRAPVNGLSVGVWPSHSGTRQRCDHGHAVGRLLGANMMTIPAFQHCVQVTPVSARWDLPRAEHGRCSCREPITAGTTECLSDLHPNVHRDLCSIALDRQPVQRDSNTEANRRRADADINIGINNRAWLRELRFFRIE